MERTDQLIKPEHLIPAATGVSGRASEIVLDAEFRDVVPPSPPAELERIVRRLFLEGCREPLFVWICRGHKILLTGYERFPTLKLHGIPFQIQIMEFVSREQARQFVIRHHLSRPNLTPLEISYLEGLRYNDEKQPRGGDRRSEAARQAAGGRRLTAEDVAEDCCEKPPTIRRAGALSTAVKTISARFGREVMPLLFSRTAKLSRQAILDLSAAEPKPLKNLIGLLRVNGKLPRDWRRLLNGAEPHTISFPLAHRPMAEAMLRRRGRDWLVEHARTVQEILDNDIQKNGSSTAKEKQP